MSPSDVSKCLRVALSISGPFLCGFCMCNSDTHYNLCNIDRCLIYCYIQVAMRVAEEKGCLIGQEVGYRIRFDDCTDPQKTAIKVRIKAFNALNLVEFCVICISANKQKQYKHVNVQIKYYYHVSLIARCP